MDSGIASDRPRVTHLKNGLWKRDCADAALGLGCPSVAKPVSRPRSRKPATVSASALTLHLDCSRTYIGKLEAGLAGAGLLLYTWRALLLP